MSIERLVRLRSARQVTVLEVVVCEGDGIGDIAREVTYFFDPSGELLAKRDPVWQSTAAFQSGRPHA